MDAATHPGQGQLYGRALFAVEDGEDYVMRARASYGIVSKLAFQLEADHAWQANESDDSSGTVELKYRVLQNDFSPLNTWRASVIGGVEFISDEDPAPHFGAVTTTIINRHGLNGQIEWAGYNDKPDEVMLNASHLYRIAPARYKAGTKGAWYTQLESLNTLYDDGDYEMDLAPGLLYEARNWAAEISLRLPVAGNCTDQPDYTLATGVRYLF